MNNNLYQTLHIAKYLCSDCCKDFFTGTLFVTKEQVRLHRSCYLKWFNPLEDLKVSLEKDENGEWKLEDD